MNILTLKTNNSIQVIDKTIIKNESGYQISDNTTYCEVWENPMYKLYTVETVPADIQPQTHCYDGTTFTVNPNFVAPPMQPEEMEKQLIVMQKAIDDLILGGVK